MMVYSYSYMKYFVKIKYGRLRVAKHVKVAMIFRRFVAISWSSNSCEFISTSKVYKGHINYQFRAFVAQTQEFKSRKKPLTFYERLGVLPTATQRDIKNAYYELALKYHPDSNRNTHTGEIFSEITKAYEVIGNVEKRKVYDGETGSYFALRGSAKKETKRPVWRLLDDRIVNIDARNIKQGESFICHLSSLSSILDVPVRVTNICRNSAVRGIPANEMRAVMLLRQICNGALSASTGSPTLTLLPSDLQCGRYYIDAYQFGNVSDLIPYAMPSLMFAPAPKIGRNNVLSLNGPTYAYNGLHVDHISKVYKPVMNQFGMSFDIEVKKRGFLPYGRGIVVVRSNPIQHFNSVEMVDPGFVTKITGRAFVAGVKPIKIAQRMAKQAEMMLKAKFSDVPVTIDSVYETESRCEGMGQGILIVAETSTSCVFSGSSLWRRGVEMETVVEIAMKELMGNLNSGGCVDAWMQDQMIVPMALANGNSIIRTGPLTSKTRSALRAIRHLTKVRFRVVKEKDSFETVLIKCKGLRYRNLYL